MVILIIIGLFEIPARKYNVKPKKIKKRIASKIYLLDWPQKNNPLKKFKPQN